MSTHDFQVIRTRFAPSPTGFMHLGNLRTALYEYLIAKVQDGQFILRIEDTDQKRYVAEAVNVIYDTMKLAAIHHDEGPDIGGPYAPYVQSERRAFYRAYAQQLVDAGAAYYCFCTPEQLESTKQQCLAEGNAYKYNGTCRNIDPGEATARMAAGERVVIRQKVPVTGTTVFEDVVYGRIEVANRLLDDQVLLKSDGLPTYNFANVVDDHLMRISHVVRGNEFLPSTPKYVLLYRSFGWQEPVYVHLPPLRKPDGKKLSKRFGDPSFQEYCRQGYLPEAIINYVALLGWNPGNAKEYFTLTELEREFSLSGLSKAPALLDLDKLKWLNGEHLRRLSEAEFHRVALPWITMAIGDGLDTLSISRMLHKRVAVLGEIPPQLDFFKQLPHYELDLYENPKMQTSLTTSLVTLKSTMASLQSVAEWSESTIREGLIALITRLQLKNGQIYWPLRIALTGKATTPGGAVEIAAVLGKAETLVRIQSAIKRLNQTEGG